jgi:hypothetical protein
MTEPSELVLRSVPAVPVIARFVVVAWVVVARRAVAFWRVVEPVAKIFPNIPVVKKAVVPRMSEAKSEVEVALVVVEFPPVKS